MISLQSLRQESREIFFGSTKQSQIFCDRNRRAYSIVKIGISSCSCSWFVISICCPPLFISRAIFRHVVAQGVFWNGVDYPTTYTRWVIARKSNFRPRDFFSKTNCCNHCQSLMQAIERRHDVWCSSKAPGNSGLWLVLRLECYHAPGGNLPVEY